MNTILNSESNYKCRPPRNPEKECTVRVIQQQEPQIKKLEEIIRLNALEKTSLLGNLEKLEQTTVSLQKKCEEQTKEFECLRQMKTKEKNHYEKELSMAHQRNKELSERVASLQSELDKFTFTDEKADEYLQLESANKEIQTTGSLLPATRKNRNISYSNFTRKKNCSFK